MVVTFKIGTLPSEEPAGTYIQDSVFGLYEIAYILINEQPTTLFTQNKTERRINFPQTTVNGDVIIIQTA